MGRYTFLEAYNLTYNDLLDLHENCLHIDQLAEDLEVTKRTLKKHLYTAGLTKKDIKFKPRKRYKRHSQLADWVRKHPHIKLPSSVPEIQKLTGLSRFTIHHYLYRRLEEYYEYVKEHWTTFLKSHKQKKTLVLGDKRIPILAIKKELLTIDKFSLRLSITFIFKNGSRKVIHIPRRYFNKVVENQTEKGV